jgi:hypothetical protein
MASCTGAGRELYTESSAALACACTAATLAAMLSACRCTTSASAAKRVCKASREELTPAVASPKPADRLSAALLMLLVTTETASPAVLLIPLVTPAPSNFSQLFLCFPIFGGVPPSCSKKREGE